MGADATLPAWRSAAILVGRLIFAAADRTALEVAEVEGADGAVGNYGDVALARSACQHVFHGRDDALLGVDGALPAAHALLGPREELVGDSLELGLGQESRRRAVVLAQSRNGLKPDAEPLRQDPGAIARLAFCARSERKGSGHRQRGIHDRL